MVSVLGSGTADEGVPVSESAAARHACAGLAGPLGVGAVRGNSAVPVGIVPKP